MQTVSGVEIDEFKAKYGLKENVVSAKTFRDAFGCSRPTSFKRLKEMRAYVGERPFYVIEDLMSYKNQDKMKIPFLVFKELPESRREFYANYDLVKNVALSVGVDIDKDITRALRIDKNLLYAQLRCERDSFPKKKLTTVRKIIIEDIIAETYQKMDDNI